MICKPPKPFFVLPGRAAAAAAGAEYYDPIDAICANGSCRTLAPDGAPIQRDYGHFTEQGAAYVLNSFKAAGLKL